MAQCEVCGNDYDKSFEVMMAGQRHVFDSFECAAHAIARSLAMASRPTARCSAALTAHRTWAFEA